MWWDYRRYRSTNECFRALATEGVVSILLCGVLLLLCGPSIRPVGAIDASLFCSPSGGVSFTAKNQALNLVPPAGGIVFDIAQGQDTINVWIRFLSTTGYGSIINIVDINNRKTGFGFSQYGVYLISDDGGCAQDGVDNPAVAWATVDYQKWAMWTVTLGQNPLNAYRNGALVLSCEGTGNSGGSGGSQLIAAHVGGFIGQLAELQILAGGSSPSDISDLYLNGPSNGTLVPPDCAIDTDQFCANDFLVKFLGSGTTLNDPHLTPKSGSPIYLPCHCAVQPCFNGALCYDGPPGTTGCLCRPGYSGNLCQTDINECVSLPCRNGATCVDHVNGFSCTCIPGWSGVTCGTDINECASTPCAHGGTCTDHLNGFTCACVAGYTGAACQTDINECASSPCTNGRTCVDGVNSFTCVDGTEPYCVGGLSFADNAPLSAFSSPATAGATLSVVAFQAPLTIAFWMASYSNHTLPASGFYPTLFSVLDPSAVPPARGRGFGLGFSPIGLTFWFGGEACIASTIKPTTAWSEYTGVASMAGNGTATLTLYVNGAPVAGDAGVCSRIPQPAFPAGVSFVTTAVNVGRNANGVLSNLRTWTRALSSAEILVDYKFRSHYTPESGPSICFQTTTNTGISNVLSSPSGSAIASPLFLVLGSQGRAQFRDCRCSPGSHTNLPCLSANATCVDIPDNIAPCNCSSPGFQGLSCQTNINDCLQHDCHNGGTCVDGIGSYTCSCPATYTGTRCQYSSVDGTNVTACAAPRNSTVYNGTSLSLSLYNTIAHQCDAQYTKGRAFDPTEAWCAQVPVLVNASDVIYRNLQQGCSDRGLLLVAQYWSPVIRPTLLDTCAPFKGWGSNIGPYFQASCVSGQAYDYSRNACVVDERYAQCGLGTSSCTKTCYSNDTCSTSPRACTCLPGHSHGDPLHCGYKIETDFCPAATGLSGSDISRSATCGVFTQDSYYECTTPFYSASNCTERCDCKLGTGDTPGSGVHCRGQEVTCTAQNSQSYCGKPDARCVKLCEFAPPFTRPSFCGFVEGSCNSVAHFPSEVCVPSNTQGYSQDYHLPTYRYNVSIVSGAQITQLDDYPFSCLCNPDSTGMKCSFTNCPEGCATHGSCANGRCTCTSQYTGCGCQIPKNPLCSTDGASCDNVTIARPSCEVCTGFGSCVPDYNSQQAPSYACSCDGTHQGPFCAGTACPNDCTGASHGSCVVPGGNKTAAFCTCRSTASCSSGDNLYGGADCSVNVCNECGMLTPGQSEKVTCAGNGACLRANTSVPYSCVCNPGFTGQFCQDQPCSPVCGANAACQSNGIVSNCVCNLGYSDLSGGTTCVTNRCGSRATPVSSTTAEFACQCNDPGMDSSTCTTNAVHNEQSCCSTQSCPVDTNTGAVCGDNAQANIYGIVPPPQCVGGGCSCGYAFVLNQTTGTCFPYCSQSTTVPSARPCTTPLGQFVCTSCTCTTGYDPSSQCYGTLCQNGATLIVTSDGGSFVCNCADGWSGTLCDQPYCSGLGRVNASTGVCDCPFPHGGDICDASLCQNGGLILGSRCVCPAMWGGRDCSVNLCAPGGLPSVDGETCLCGSVYSGSHCESPLCLHGSLPLSGDFNHCDCTTGVDSLQYSDALCGTRICGPSGVYFSSNDTCACTVNGIASWNATIATCTTGLCGPFGTISTDHSACNCQLRTSPIPILSLNATHNVVCEPICVAPGVYNATLRACSCPLARIGPHCDFPSSTGAIARVASSSTALAHSTAMSYSVRTASVVRCLAFAITLGATALLL